MTMVSTSRLTPEELQDLYTELDQNAPLMLFRFVLHPDGTSSFPYVSRGVEAVYGVTVNQVLSNEHNLTAFVHPNHADSLATSISHSAQTMTTWYWEGEFCALMGKCAGFVRPRTRARLETRLCGMGA